MMKKYLFYGLVGVIIFIVFGIKFNSIVPKGVYPDPDLTPGKYDTLSLEALTARYDGKTYSQAHRSVSQSTKEKVYRLYGVKYPQPKGSYEVDHFFPECAGGADDITNLWLEPEHVSYDGRDFGYHIKDRLETWGCREIKKGNLDPRFFYEGITTNWVQYYLENESQIEKLKSVDSDGDN